MEILVEMEEYARSNYVPIARKANIEFLQELIKREHLYNVLELGSAIGYSAICMAGVDDKVKVTTIERDEILYNKAVENIEKSGFGDRINIIFDDIFNVDINGRYDLIFIDAAKAQYIKFFEKVSPCLSDKGVIVSDNIELLDLQRLTNSKKSKKLIEKMQAYKTYLLELENYDTEFLDIGDGFAITRKNK